MGAWGAGSFDNDAALDFADSIEVPGDLEAPLSIASEDEIDADQASAIIVVAECVAALQGNPLADLPEELAATLKDFPEPSGELIDTVRDHLSAVISRSELVDLWAEEGSGDWNRAVTDLMQRLNAPVTARQLAKYPPTKPGPTVNRSPCSFCGEEMGEGAFTQFDITVSEDEISSMKLGGWAHLTCLNAALHPRHIIQHWDFDDEMLDRMRARREAGED